MVGSTLRAPPCRQQPCMPNSLLETWQRTSLGWFTGPQVPPYMLIACSPLPTMYVACTGNWLYVLLQIAFISDMFRKHLWCLAACCALPIKLGHITNSSSAADGKAKSCDPERFSDLLLPAAQPRGSSVTLWYKQWCCCQHAPAQLITSCCRPSLLALPSAQPDGNIPRCWRQQSAGACR